MLSSTQKCSARSKTAVNFLSRFSRVSEKKYDNTIKSKEDDAD